MWLEEMAWLWGPMVSGIGIWVVWRVLALKAELRALRQRVERLEATMTVRSSQSSAA